MDITPQDNTTTQPISDDQDLAKALAGVLPDEPATADMSQDTPVEEPVAMPGLQFEETPVATPAVNPVGANGPQESVSSASLSSMPAPLNPTPAPSSSTTPLDAIKSQALTELRPLIDRVELPAEEKFDTYLMLIRSTDDTSLIAPAYAAAQTIADEKRKAEALLDIIKEIDYLSRKDQQI